MGLIMANLGILLQNKFTPFGRKYLRNSKLKGGGSLQLKMNGVISGVARQGVVALAHKLVFLHDRKTGALLAKTRTAQDGGFKIENIDDTSNDFYIVCVDPHGDTYNDVIFSRI